MGVVLLKDRSIADRDGKTGQLMSTDVIKAVTKTDQKDVARLLQDADRYAVPIVDLEVRLVGIVTVDGAMDILDEETTEDIFDKAGLVNLTRAETTRSGLLVEWIPVSCLEGPAAFSAHHPCGRNAVSGIHS